MANDRTRTTLSTPDIKKTAQILSFFSPSFLRSVVQFNSTLLDACVPLVTSALQISNDDDDDDDERRIMMMRSNSWRTRRLH